MPTLKLTLEIELPDVFILDNDEKEWMKNEILVTNGQLMLYSSELQDEIGSIMNISNIRWQADKTQIQPNGVSRKSEEE